MLTTQPITTLINRRFSCRKYLPQPIDAHLQHLLRTYLANVPAGPLGNRARFELIAATEEDHQVLRGLGTYGFIRGATAFIVGALKAGEKNLEDFGYLMELLILQATDLGLGTCWLGGTFTKSSFSRKIALTAEEIVPAVASVGVIADEARVRDSGLRHYLGAHSRKPWADLFFSLDFDHPLSHEEAESFVTPLEMVRLAPSASNKQPWRIVRKGADWHLYLFRTPGYRDVVASRLIGVEDLQRIDMGIAMCHFELTARELGLPGAWKIKDPGLEGPDKLTEYLASWMQDEQ
jgi:nitroreductase